MHSCCTQKDCLNAFEMNELSLHGFSLDELDSICFISFEDESFSKIVDSALIPKQEIINQSAEKIQILIPIDFNEDNTYSIVFYKIKRNYLITDIETSQLKCNDCFLSSDTYKEISSYKVNGNKQDNNCFKLDH
jgi:hypothetical protein